MLRALLLISCLVFFLSCSEGEDWLLPSGETHRVNAYVNESSLSHNAIIRQSDTIRPYFASHDPDIQGLMVFLQDSSGKSVGEKVLYRLRVSQPQLQQLFQSFEGLETEDSDVENQEEHSDLDVNTANTTTAAAPATPSNTTAVNTTSATSSANAGASDYRVIYIESLDDVFPSFTIANGLPIGQYIMIFQVWGERNMLYQLERPIFFLGNAEFEFDGIRRYLPGSVTNIHFIPQGIDVMISAGLTADASLDPYIVWFNGKNIIAEGRVSDNAHKLMWRSPDQNGFHTIRAEVFPFQPIRRQSSFGLSRELSLAVSSKSRLVGHFEDRADLFSQYYRFNNNLLDSVNPGVALKSDRRPIWLERNETFGLALDRGNAHLLPPETVRFSQEEEITGQIAIRLMPVADGTVFRATFDTAAVMSESPSFPLNMRVLLSDSNLILSVSSETLFHEEIINLETINRIDFLTTYLTFNLSHTRFSAQLFLEETNTETNQIAFDLPIFFSGEGTFKLGETSNTSAVAIINELGVIFTRNRPI